MPGNGRCGCRHAVSVILFRSARCLRNVSSEDDRGSAGGLNDDTLPNDTLPNETLLTAALHARLPRLPKEKSVPDSGSSGSSAS